LQNKILEVRNLFAKNFVKKSDDIWLSFAKNPRLYRKPNKRVGTFIPKIKSKMRTLELNEYGVMEMNSQEIQKTEGGNWLKVLYAAGAAAVTFCVDQYDDLKKGWKDAAAEKPYNYQPCK